MVDEVVPGQSVDTLRVAGHVGDSDGDDLPLPRGRRDPGGVVEQHAGVGREHRCGHHGGHIPAASRLLDDLGDRGAVSNDQLVDHLFCVGGHTGSVGVGPDTALSRTRWAYRWMVIEVSVLDVVELRRDGQRIEVRPGKTTEVLVRLALEAGVLVRTDRLIEDLWAGEAVGTARNVLQTKVSRLRRDLGDAALVAGSRAGYILQVDPGAVDAL